MPNRKSPKEKLDLAWTEEYASLALVEARTMSYGKGWRSLLGEWLDAHALESMVLQQLQRPRAKQDVC
eukprot:Skav225042  [mRNA]  locus=scaffold2061:344620:348900:- [translate_table: standard]